jgi:hypothetical protein
VIYTSMITTMLNEKGGLPVKIRDSVVFVTGANRMEGQTLLVTRSSG